ncbi:transcription factor grauzone-like [Lucilia cuprina]|uniref:transcription factor grauzone-like n=1 Tax=Lucilia cuprina TaxID=7375 RepID=UPI001F054653|nr:transcription factor grauzone-like [Lucilia cuprina]
MICRLCLKDFEEIINIFDSHCGQELNVADVIGKHFWFEPRKDDPISTSICKLCWVKVREFHEFYEMVEHVHRHMTERFIVKTESAKGKRRSPLNVNDLINYSSLPSKREPDDEFNELGEVPFNMLIEDTNDEPGKTVAKAAAIALGAEDSRDILSQHNFSQDDYDDVGDSNRCNETYNEDAKFNDTNDTQNSDNDDTFDGEAFMKNILTNKNKEPVKNQNSSNSSSPKADKRRSTRNSNKSQLNNTDSDNGFNTTTDIKRRRGRPKKGELVVKSERCTKQSKEKLNKSEEEQDAYKAKMKEIDDQIAQYMTLHCEVCSSESENFAGLRAHMREAHSIKKGYAKCCNKKFLKRALLLDHIRQHLDPDCYRCEECDRTFADRQSMRNHFLVKHQKDEDKIYECSVCSKKFVRKYLLEQHKMFAHRDRSTTCKSCNRRFNTLEELYEHNKQHCSYGTMCDICAKVIRGPAAFKRHQLEHQGVTMPKVQCDLCGSWHKDKYALNKHKKRHMESKQPHVCDICHKVSPSRSAMLSHKRYVHGTERSYECGVCRKTFKKPIALREHMTTHTGEVLYRCPHCPKTFNSNANMHSHRKKVHPREFEETRKLRKQNAHLIEQPIPTISVLSNAKKETQALLVIGSGQSEESHHVLITTSANDFSDDDDDVTDLSKEKITVLYKNYSIN